MTSYRNNTGIYVYQGDISEVDIKLTGNSSCPKTMQKKASGSSRAAAIMSELGSPRDRCAPDVILEQEEDESCNKPALTRAH